MNKFRLYNRKKIQKLLDLRNGEVKLGEKLQFISNFDDLSDTDAEFVIFGIPEDIGVRANYGKLGAASAWQAFLTAFLNIQHNRFLNKKNILLLGEVDTLEFMEKAGKIDVSDPNYHQKLGDLVAELDKVVSEVVQSTISAGKFPIVIGGGHNNAYGNIKGASEALKKKINVLNIDAHTDLRLTNYRHSGNGFSFAMENNFLNKYAVFGLHENYTPEYIFEEMQDSENLHYHLLEDTGLRHFAKFEESLGLVKDGVFGLEVDCDSIANFPSSAISPSGLSLDEVRQFVSRAAKEKNCIYLHICEAVDNGDYPTGKALSYLVSDFIKGHRK